MSFSTARVPTVPRAGVLVTSKYEPRSASSSARPAATPPAPRLAATASRRGCGHVVRASEDKSDLPVSRDPLAENMAKGGKDGATSSLICDECEGEGAIACSQCKGGGKNLEDHFQGRYKTGQVCWLCRGRKQMLCGNCNGAGFVGGFLSKTG